MSSYMNILIDMGFSKIKVVEALNMTGNVGVEAAMEWLLAHSGAESLTTDSLTNKRTEPSSAIDQRELSTSNAEQVLKSFKCDECNKLLKNDLEMEFHASKLGHDKFSECNEQVKQLTDEEKKKQLEIVEEKLKQKRKDRAEKEKTEALEKEKNRIRSGKEILQAKKRLEELEIKKIVDQRKREKEEEKLARQKIKLQIEADKIARKSKIVINNIHTDNVQPSSTTCDISKLENSGKHYCETKLQIRLTDGRILTQTFGSKEQLSAVRLFIEINRTDDSGPFIMLTNFPRKVFADHDFETPLDVLGLVPSAVIIVQKKFNQVN